MENIFEIIIAQQQKQNLEKVLECNKKTEQFKLVLSEEEAKALILYSKDLLKENERVEFGEGILPKLIDIFCDSQYINQDNYANTLLELQDIFYLYKSELQDELTDDELLTFMKQQYEEICFGDLEYLKSTCLERFVRAIRFGYQCRMQKRLRDEYSLKDIENEYNQFSEETRWEYEIYKLRLEDM